LFFGPTQNTPIGFAQICLRQIPSEDLLSWGQKLQFWKKDHEHWKQLSWKVGDGSAGLFVFDPRFSRSGKEKILQLIEEYETRDDVKSQHAFYFKGLQDYQSAWSPTSQLSKDSFVLEPLNKSFKNYQDYLSSLNSEVISMIKASWKNLNQKAGIELGDYAGPLETRFPLDLPADQISLWAKWGAQVLTFEKESCTLGCILVLKGKSGNIFFEPFPFEPEGNSIVSDDLYIQYALLKFFEMPEARKCHLMKFGAKLVFDEKEDLKFFHDQGFQHKTITQVFSSRLPGLEKLV
jgi:hypothetical protein